MNTKITTTIKIPTFISTAVPKYITNPTQPNVIPTPQTNLNTYKPPISVPPNPLGVMGIEKPTENDKFGVWCASLPTPTVQTDDEIEWIKQYQAYLYSLLETIIPNEEVRKVFVSYENMGTWIQALTHETFNPNKNYEVYEIIGDALVAGAFIKYLYSWNPKVTPAEITSFSSNYLGKGKDFQSKISFQLKFTDWTLKVGNIDLYNISEDIFESFLGVLDRIAFNVQDTLKAQGKFDLSLQAYAGEVVYRFIVMLFTGIPINEEYGQGSAFTTLGEYAAALGSKEKFFNINIGSAANNYNTTVTLLERGQYLLSKEFDSFKNLHYNYLLGSASGASDKQAKNLAAEQAIRNLTLLGASPSWMRTIRINSQLKNVDGYDEALESFSNIPESDPNDIGQIIYKGSLIDKGNVLAKMNREDESLQIESRQKKIL